LYPLNIKFQEKIFTSKKVIKLWNFGNFCKPKIIPKSLVTLRFSKVSLHELKGICRCFQTRFLPNFYVHPTYSNTCFFKVGERRVLLQGTVHGYKVKDTSWVFRRIQYMTFTIKLSQNLYLIQRRFYKFNSSAGRF
jgi:hypothetical protein